MIICKAFTVILGSRREGKAFAIFPKHLFYNHLHGWRERWYELYMNFNSVMLLN
jgi:hypothetical protein